MSSLAVLTIVGWCIAKRGSEIAAELITHACRNFDPKGLVLHSDNGKPMRASTPYSEALFRTLKHTPAYPRLPFESLACARRWMTAFAAWYNREQSAQCDPVCDPG